MEFNSGFKGLMIP